MKTKHLVLLIGASLSLLSSLFAAVVEDDYYATFQAKLHLEGDKVYVDCDSLKVHSQGKLKPVRHIEAVEIDDINFVKLKAAAAKGLTITVNGRFSEESGHPNGPLYFVIANSKGKR
jgi:hypothetical protein